MAAFARSNLIFPRLAALGALALTGFARQDPGILVPVQVSKKYASADLGTIEAIGACSISPGTISCWDASGSTNSDLTKEIRAHYESGAGAKIPYRFGRKNRLVVFKLPSERPGIGTRVWNVSSENGEYPGSAGYIGPKWEGGSPYLDWYNIDSDLKAKRTSIRFEVMVPFGTGTVPLKKGAETDIGTMKVHIDSINRGPDRNPLEILNFYRKTWQISVTVSGFPGSIAPTLGGLALDAKGDVVNTIDRDGTAFQASTTGYVISGGIRRQVTRAPMVQAIRGAGTAHQVLWMPINPTDVSALSLTANGIRIVTITDIPLDPK